MISNQVTPPPAMEAAQQNRGGETATQRDGRRASARVAAGVRASAEAKEAEAQVNKRVRSVPIAKVRAMLVRSREIIATTESPAEYAAREIAELKPVVKLPKVAPIPTVWLIGHSYEAGGLVANPVAVTKQTETRIRIDRRWDRWLYLSSEGIEWFRTEHAALVVIADRMRKSVNDDLRDYERGLAYLYLVEQALADDAQAGAA